MLKTATLTWNSFYNYGTCLQAYALQHFIESIGYENLIIDDSRIITENNRLQGINGERKSKKNKWTKRWKKLWQSFHSKYRAFYKYQRILCPSINHYKIHSLKIYYDIESVLTDKADFDVYICGSDQIWKPEGFENMQWPFYYASFTPKPKIAYAPSIGKYQIPEIWKKKVSELIAPFSVLSVREEAGREAIQELTDKPVELVADPTLLLSRQEWDAVLPAQKNKKEKYVLGYILTPNQQLYKIARDYAHQHGMKFYLFMLNLEDYGQADRLVSGGPFEFLRYIHDAETVFTDSYHGTIFSAIFETPFYTFKRFADDSPINQNSRIETLLTFMGATDRLIDEGNKVLIDKMPDFNTIKNRLNPLIEHSKAFLRTSLSAIEESLNK